MESMRKVGENKSFKVEEQRLDLKFWHKLDFFFFFLMSMVRVSREGRIAKCIAILLPSLSYTLSTLA